jgi:hypothetical protein
MQCLLQKNALSEEDDAVAIFFQMIYLFPKLRAAFKPLSDIYNEDLKFSYSG